MIVTSHTQQEHDQAVALLNKLPCKIVLNEYNPDARPMKSPMPPSGELPDRPELAFHRNVVVIKRL